MGTVICDLSISVDGYSAVRPPGAQGSKIMAIAEIPFTVRRAQAVTRHRITVATMQLSHRWKWRQASALVLRRAEPALWTDANNAGHEVAGRTLAP